jgi:hypothetical protein
MAGTGGRDTRKRPEEDIQFSLRLNALTGIRIKPQERLGCIVRSPRDLAGVRAVDRLKQQAGHQVAREQSQECFGHGIEIAAVPRIRERVMNSEDAKEGIKSFVERRAAVFTGR